MKKMKKNLTIPKKTEKGTFWYFQHPFCRKTPEKMKAEPLRKNFCLKEIALCRNNEKNEKKFYRIFFEIFLKSPVA